MENPIRIPVPLPHVGSVNTWLLRGEPVTLVDTGPRDDEALAALEAGLARAGLRVEDIELVLVTHHHVDHTGLAATIAGRSGARVAAFERAAAYGRDYDERTAADRRFSLALMRHHGVPEAVIADNEGFWDFIRRMSEGYDADAALPDGASIRAGGRDLRVVARPGHSTSDALLVDERDGIAFVGDHMLAGISSNTEIYPAIEADGTRPRARVEYLRSLRQTAAMPLNRLLTGHGDEVDAHADLVRRRLADHDRRCDRIVAALRHGRASAFEIAGQLWSARTVAEQPLLVLWEVLGHLDPPARRGAGRGARDQRRQHLRRRVLRARRHHPDQPQRLGAVLHEPADILSQARPADARDRFDLSGRVAVVTGATRGLGLAMVRGFAQAGAEVVVVSRKPEACDEVAAALQAEGAKAAACACHVGHWDELDGLVEALYRDFGRVDILVNNAGISPPYDKLSAVSEELFDKIIAVNLKGPFRLAALVGERMVAGDGGSIINVSSTGAVRPTSDIVPYAAAKAGVNAMTVGLAHAFGPRVRVNAIMPGPFLTTIARAWDMDLFAERARTFPARRAGEADEIVGAALYLASDASSYTTGTILTVDGGAQWSMAGTGAGGPNQPT